MFLNYVKSSYCVIPSKNGVPQIKWGEYQKRLPTHAEASLWDKGSYNYELVCGEVSGVIAIDIDVDDRELMSLVADCNCIKIGSKGCTAFYAYNGEKGLSWGGVVELLSDKHLCALPPSIHRKTGKPYVWKGKGLLDVTLQPLPQAIIEQLNTRYPKPKRIKYERHDFSDSVELPEAEKMLQYIDASMARQDWIQIGMALRDEYGDGARWLWHEWSAKSSKYNQKAADDAWRSFHGTGVGIGTLVYYAQEGGYIRVSEEVDFSAFMAMLRKEKKKPRPTIKVHGLVGEIADWITASAIRPQPMLSLAAALAFVGAMKGHYVRTPSRLCTNMLVMGLAPTGAGKDHPQQCIDRLMKACGMQKHLLGEPTSGTGLLTGLLNADCVGLLNIDEVGRYLKNISMKSSGSHQREIVDYIIKLFNRADSTFQGKQYASNKEHPRQILEKPHLVCMGMSVSERFKESAGSTDIIDGFMNRWLMFSTHARPSKQQDRQSVTPPQELVDKILAWREKFEPKRSLIGEAESWEIRFSKEAWRRYVEYEAEADRLIDTTPHPFNAMYSRSAEHVQKVALCLCDGKEISVQDVECAIEIEKRSTVDVLAICGELSDNESEGEFIRLKKVIKDNSPITLNQLRVKSQWLKGGPRRRNEILEVLLDDGAIRIEEVSSKGAGMKSKLIISN